ncbi:unnamed protein product [Prorocentrum cordatum]|uniref:Selenoprotein O n=1 Tax=Prorocentrum cordatum TaxID=2364126 RepID=A0ABN9REK7_9DINO|nr:unnamed protein product [Polarella glacialis]
MPFDFAEDFLGPAAARAAVAAPEANSVQGIGGGQPGAAEALYRSWRWFVGVMAASSPKFAELHGDELLSGRTNRGDGKWAYSRPG